MTEISAFGDSVREFAKGLLRLREDWPGSPLSERTEPVLQKEFPGAGIDLIYHELRVQLDVGAKGVVDETVTLYGTMLIQRDAPRVNDEGFRQIDFRVLAWSAVGWSTVLRQGLTYALSADVEQPISRILAETRESDFPAAFLFEVTFDARVNNITVFRQHEGRPEGHNFLAVPPSGDRRLSPTIRTFEDARIRVAQEGVGEIEAIPLDCNDAERSRTLITF
jgi:hypothetical protein